jgi:hypothetical protein
VLRNIEASKRFALLGTARPSSSASSATAIVGDLPMAKASATMGELIHQLSSAVERHDRAPVTLEAKSRG